MNKSNIAASTRRQRLVNAFTRINLKQKGSMGQVVGVLKIRKVAQYCYKKNARNKAGFPKI